MVNPILLRQFLGKRLAMYFAQQVTPVGRLSAPLTFPRLFGHWGYRRAVAKSYADTDAQWLTPVELFRPHYSRSLAHYMLLHTPPSEPLVVYELGGGSGANAEEILSHIRDTSPDRYATTQYVLLEGSGELATMQLDRMKESQHAGRAEVRVLDLGCEDLISVMPRDSRRSWILALEVLDNLAHDKVVRRGERLYQTEVVETNGVDGNATEFLVPLTDPLLRDFLDAVPSYAPTEPHLWEVAFFVPTVAYSMLRAIRKNLPLSQLLFADFDFLPAADVVPGPSLRAIQAPLITCLEDCDWPCYLAAPELCDVLFPTDFNLLERMVGELWCSGDGNARRRVEVFKQGAFLQKIAPKSELAATRTLFGYNPMVEDFSNVSVLSAVLQQGSEFDQP